MDITERICLECGKPFKARNENFMCQRCIRKILSESSASPVRKEDAEHEEGFTYIYKPRKGKTQLEKDAKNAADLGMSYGEYVANIKHDR